MMDYMPIPKGAQAPILKFETDVEFQKELSKYRHEIHIRTLYAIDYAVNTNYDEEITIAFLNDDETILGCPPDVWSDNLEMTLDYFEEIEDYEKCQEVKNLIDKIKSKK